MNLTGLIIGAATFLCIGIFHPIVIKAEYYLGTRCWLIFAMAGVIAVFGALLVENVIVSSLLGVFAFSAFWSIYELFEQEKRVERGWFPKNPKKK